MSGPAVNVLPNGGTLEHRRDGRLFQSVDRVGKTLRWGGR